MPTEPQYTLAPETAEWLETNRKIPCEIAANFGVVTVNGNPAFEFWKDGTLQYRKVRYASGDGKSFMRDRKEVASCLFLENHLQDSPDLSSPLVVCEGEIDALSFVAAGIANVVSVPDGAQLSAPGTGAIVPETDKPFSWLWDANGLKKHLAQFERVILATDDDAKGRVLRDELAVRFDRWRCDYVVFPKGCKDANDVLCKHGVEGVQALVTTVRPIVPNALVTFSELPHSGSGEIFESGFKGLDDARNGGLGFGLVAPELVIITGAPGSGKSEFAVCLGANLARIHGLRGAILQFEDRGSRVRDTLKRYALNQVPEVGENSSQALAWVDEWFRTIAPEEGVEGVDHDLTWLKATMREARVRHNCRWIIIDPWNELDHMWDRSLGEAQYTNDALRKLKQIARSLHLILMIVAHPSKEGGRVQEIGDMDLYGISGAAAWNNKADHGIIVHRPDKAKPEVYIKIAKSKEHTIMGKPGIVRMKYDWACSTYRYIGMGV